ncbi:MAG: hypothetical protein KDA54_08455 [Phycisphaerales bacterium]|nr:hypothetical protein [Phycisphaerales bacterium]
MLSVPDGAGVAAGLGVGVDAGSGVDVGTADGDGVGEGDGLFSFDVGEQPPVQSPIVKMAAAHVSE